MQKVKLGAEPQAGAERDAVHVAVYPTVAATKLYPGQHVGMSAVGASSGQRCGDGDYDENDEPCGC